MEIVPAILTNSKADLFKKLNFLKSRIQLVQIDVADGVYVESKTFPLDWLEDYNSQFDWDLHLMVKNPFSWVEKCGKIGVFRIVGHIDEMNDQLDFVDKVEGEGVAVGLAINLDLPTKKINFEAVMRSSLVLVMSVNAGKSGQKFDKSALKKVDKLVSWRKELGASFKIGIDGGINTKNIKELEERGVDVAYVGSGIWQGNWEENFEKLIGRNY